MKKCLRCNEEMILGLNLVQDSINGGLEISEKKLHSKNVTVRPKISLCAKCGYIELYAEDVDKVRKYM